MKSHFLIPILLLPAVLAGPAFAGGSLVLRNPEDLAFHYILDPPELAGANLAALSFRMKLVDYFLEEAPAVPEGSTRRFSALLPGGTARIANLSEGRHLLVGFFVLPNELYFPVSIWEARVEGSDRQAELVVRREPSLIWMRAGEGCLSAFTPGPPEPAVAAGAGTPSAEPAVQAGGGDSTGAGAKGRPQVPARGDAQVPAEPGVRVPTEGREMAGAGAPQPVIRIDRDYGDWEDVPPLALFSGIFEPAFFTRESAQGWEVLPLKKSRFWGTAGAQLGEIKAIAAGGSFYFYMSTQSALSPDLSYYLYFRGRDTGRGENRVTLEIVPAERDLPGLVLLWKQDEQGGAHPEAIGRLVSDSFFLEGKASRRLLFEALGEAAGSESEVSFDLTSCYFDRSSGVYEEFYFTSVFLRDVPLVR